MFSRTTMVIELLLYSIAHAQSAVDVTRRHCIESNRTEIHLHLKNEASQGIEVDAWGRNYDKIFPLYFPE
jgi:P pilus assembly chaperone PapD